MTGSPSTADTTAPPQRSGEGGPRPRSSRLLAGLVRGYQRLRAGRPSPCRYEPSCSAYALQALESHGAWRGSWYSVRRVLRCHPWGGYGWDPPPERKAG